MSAATATMPGANSSSMAKYYASKIAELGEVSVCRFLVCVGGERVAASRISSLTQTLDFMS